MEHKQKENEMQTVIAIVVKVVLVYFLWNWLMPTMFGLITIDIWQAFGISFLSGLLFKPTPRVKDKE